MSIQQRNGEISRAVTAGGVIALVLPLAVYLLTLPPGLTWAHDGADGGDLIAAAATLGIPHPPGYPLYTLLARLFILVPWGTPAHRIALLSAVAGAGTAWLVFRAGLLLAGKRYWPAALSTSLLWAFAPIPWGQSVIAEVYALAALLGTGFLLGLLRWRASGDAWPWRLGWLCFGMGLAHHPLIAAFLLPAALWVWEGRSHLRRGRWLEAAGAVLAGLLLYVYLPIRAAASPPINWGDPRTLSRFWWLVSAAPYRQYVFGLPLAEWPARVSVWAGLMLSQFKVWGVALGLWGAVALHERDRMASRGLIGAFALITLYTIGYNTTDSYVYLLPAFAVFALWITFGIADLWQRATVSKRRSRWIPAALAAALAAMPIVSLGMDWRSADLTSDREAQAFVEESLAALPPDALVLATGDRQTFALWYARWAVESPFQGEVISVPLLQFDWYRSELRDRNPALALPPSNADETAAVNALVARNLPRQPIYVTAGLSAALASSRLIPAGPLFKVAP